MQIIIVALHASICIMYKTRPFIICNYHQTSLISFIQSFMQLLLKKHLLFWQLHLSPELQLLTRIVPCGSQLWEIQHTWSTGTAEVATRTGKFAKTSDKCYTQQQGHSLVTDKYEYCDIYTIENSESGMPRALGTR